MQRPLPQQAFSKGVHFKPMGTQHRDRPLLRRKPIGCGKRSGSRLALLCLHLRSRPLIAFSDGYPPLHATCE